MTEDTLEKAVELKEIIDDTRRGLVGLRKIKEDVREEKEERNYDDGLYNLAIRQYGDGSGVGCSFSRYRGNARLLEVIIKEVEEELARCEKELAAF